MRQKKTQEPLTPEEEYDRAASAAARMLSRRPLSERALSEKLHEKEFSEDAADYAVERMKVLGALDDRAYAERVVQSYRRKGCGRLRILQELEHRRVPKELAQEALDAFEPDWDAMIAILEKKLHGDVSDRKQNDKACAALQRRGFSFAQIREAMQRYRESVEETTR